MLEVNVLSRPITLLVAEVVVTPRTPVVVVAFDAEVILSTLSDVLQLKPDVSEVIELGPLKKAI